MKKLVWYFFHPVHDAMLFLRHKTYRYIYDRPTVHSKYMAMAQKREQTKTCA